MPKVFIGVGHGGKDPGAVANGFKESEINLTMALAAQKELIRHGVIVGMSRIIEENDPLSDEIKEANAFNPDIAVEFHTNAGGGDGFEAYRQQTGKFAADSYKLAQLIESRVKELGQNSRGIKGEKSPLGFTFGWLSGCNCPAVLCECAFIDNKTDLQIIDTLEEQRAFGVAYAKGVLDYLGIAWKPAASIMYGVARQVIALSDKTAAEKYASQMNAEDKDAYYKAIEVAK